MPTLDRDPTRNRPGHAASGRAGKTRGRRPAWTTWTFAVVLAFTVSTVRAQPAADETGVRAALAACADAWNRHDPKAFGRCITTDAWISEGDDSYYKRFQGRDKVLAVLDYNLRQSDLRWEVLQIRPQPDGTVAVVLRQHVDMLPKTAGRYAMSFESDPTFARLRRDGGAWKLSFLTSHKGWARALVAELDRPPAAPPVAPPRPAALPAVSGTEPAAYTTFYGVGGQGCNYCHGRPPSVSDESTRSRIVAVGAATADGAALRRAMARPALGKMMERQVADPALSDAQLDAIRLWLRALRDGRVEHRPDRLVIHNPRAERDPPVRFAVLRAQGWRLPAEGGCRIDRPLPGGTSCELPIPQGRELSLVYRFAPSPGLTPAEVTVPVGGGTR